MVSLLLGDDLSDKMTTAGRSTPVELLLYKLSVLRSFLGSCYHELPLVDNNNIFLILRLNLSGQSFLCVVYTSDFGHPISVYEMLRDIV